MRIEILGDVWKEYGVGGTLSACRLFQADREIVKAEQKGANRFFRGWSKSSSILNLDFLGQIQFQLIS